MAKQIEDIYQKKDLHQHVLDRPDSYLGSTKATNDDMFVLVEKDNKVSIEKKNIAYTPALIKIFDEILVNAVDHTVRDKTCDVIKVDIDPISGVISIFNNGSGVPVVKHKEYNVFVPELIFGNLLTGSNYDDSDERIVGGVNGLGSKLANIYSTRFTIDTVDSSRNLRYKQTFTDNMYKKGEPKIEKSDKASYTKITFSPDLKRFGIKGKGFPDDTVALMKKRVYDTVANTNEKVSVYLNKEKLKQKDFKSYTELYNQPKLFYESVKSSHFVWEIAFGVSENYNQVSFVNGISTTQGGKHVEYVSGQLIKRVKAMIETKKKLTNVKNNYIKDKLFVFVRSTIVNPSFSNQSKELLTTPSKDFGIAFDLSDKLIKAFYKDSGIVDEIVSFANYKLNKDLDKAGAVGKKKNKIRVNKLDDAEYAGTSRSNECSLILTEGDSAKTFAVAGLSIIGRQKYGIFSLRGKLLNVREATRSQLINNEEINNIKKIINLEHNKDYSKPENLALLRYTSVIILTDQDVDGIHISGLLMNMFHYWFPELLEGNKFLMSMKTPIVKVSRKNETIDFFTLQDYNTWIKKTEKSNLWNTKYYKGLGTSTSKEAKEIFKGMDNNIIKYISKNEKTTNEAITLAFEKKRTDDRKDWLLSYDNSMILDQADTDVTYPDFVNKNLIHFSMYDVVRSIPNLIDGLKPSQRKVIYTLFKKNYSKEVKVAQFGASVAELTHYHHGEASLYSTIIGMAQDYMGTNNINLLNPNGNFGTRLMSGKDASSPRYIFTEASDKLKEIFKSDDFNIINYNFEDTEQIEPVYYVPTIPMILVNGCQGIGTGFSTFVPQYNPKDIIQNMKALVGNGVYREMTPWYRGFKGKISKATDISYNVYGVFDYDKEKSVINITEIPINVSTEDYIKTLDALTDTSIDYISFKNKSTDIEVHFELKVSKTLKITKEELYKTLKLTKALSINNMHLFDKNGAIKKYKTSKSILQHFFTVRLDHNEKRKKYLMDSYTETLNVLNNKIRFLKEIMDNKLTVYRVSKKDLVLKLSERKYTKSQDSYDYLTNMPIYSFTSEKLKELADKSSNVNKKLKDLSVKSSKDILLEDLEEIKI
jgi:DNA topoisomerase-2